ncbi:MAG: response regulator [Bacteroidia bacterium]
MTLYLNNDSVEGPQRDYILVIEDSPSDVRLLKYCLDNQGFPGDIHVCNYGKAAIDFLFGNTRMYPRLILMDIRLPDINGLELFRKLKSHPDLADTYMIIWTGQYSEVEARQCEELDVVEYFEKPLDMGVLSNFASRLTYEWAKICNGQKFELKSNR